MKAVVLHEYGVPEKLIVMKLSGPKAGAEMGLIFVPV
jgi:hypothetical protein